MVDDPLAKLVIDETQLAREELAGLLQPYLRFTRQGDLVLQPAFDQLAARQKVCCVLLALRALSLLDLRDRPGGTPQEVIALSGMPPGTVRPKLTDLSRMRLAGREGADYLIPIPAVHRAAAFIQGANDD